MTNQATRLETLLHQAEEEIFTTLRKSFGAMSDEDVREAAKKRVAEALERAQRAKLQIAVKTYFKVAYAEEATALAIAKELTPSE